MRCSGPHVRLGLPFPRLNLASPAHSLWSCVWGQISPKDPEGFAGPDRMPKLPLQRGLVLVYCCSLLVPSLCPQEPSKHTGWPGIFSVPRFPLFPVLIGPYPSTPGRDRGSLTRGGSRPPLLPLSFSIHPKPQLPFIKSNKASLSPLHRPRPS